MPPTRIVFETVVYAAVVHNKNIWFSTFHWLWSHLPFEEQVIIDDATFCLRNEVLAALSRSSMPYHKNVSLTFAFYWIAWSIVKIRNLRHFAEKHRCFKHLKRSLEIKPRRIWLSAHKSGRANLRLRPKFYPLLKQQHLLIRNYFIIYPPIAAQFVNKPERKNCSRNFAWIQDAKNNINCEDVP